MSLDFSRAEYTEPQVIEASAAPPTADNAAFVRAIGYGALAALLGSLIYALVGLWIQIGYVSLLVGGMVGKGMMNGSRGIGGRRYQVAAVVLTYFAVTIAIDLDWLWDAGRHGNNVVDYAASHFFALVFLALFGPIVTLFASLGSGLIDILILFVGMRAAWRIVKGDADWVAPPPMSLTGDDPGPTTLGLRD